MGVARGVGIADRPGRTTPAHCGNLHVNQAPPGDDKIHFPDEHPGEPKAGSGRLLPLANITGANLGLTFEYQGLSTKVVLERGKGSVPAIGQP